MRKNIAFWQKTGKKQAKMEENDAKLKKSEL